MTLRGALLALLWSALLAAAVVATARGVPDRDSSRLAWLTGEVEGVTTRFAMDDVGALVRERNEPLRLGIEEIGRGRGVAADLALGVHLTLALAAFFVVLGERGASAGWAAAATAGAAVLLQAVARFGHPSWLWIGAFVPWIASLRAVAADPRPRRWLGCVAWLVCVFATSRLWFQAAVLVSLGGAFALAARSRAHAAASLGLLAIAAGLAVADAELAGVAPSPEATLQAIPFAFTGRALAGELSMPELFLLGPFLAAALSSLVLERRLRSFGILAAFLGWASLGPHTPALPILGRPPALRAFEWVPGAGEFFLPLLFALAAGVLVVALGARFLSGVTPPIVGVIAAFAALAVPLRGLGPDAFGDPRPPPQPIERGGASRVAVWPLAFESVEAALARPVATERVANLEPDVLGALARLLPARPNLLWTERFYDALEGVGIGVLRLESDPGPLPGFLRPLEGAPRRVRIDGAARRARFRRLEAIDPAAWSATSSTLAAATSAAENAFDGRPDTRWGSGQAQQPGQFYQLDLGRAVDGVTRVEVDVGIFESDRPRSLRVETSVSGVTWRTVATEPRPPLGEKRLVIDFPAETVRGLRLTQLGRDRALDWSIAEIRVWRDPAS